VAAAVFDVPDAALALVARPRGLRDAVSMLDQLAADHQQRAVDRAPCWEPDEEAALFASATCASGLSSRPGLGA
jgi:hypothetical protein